MADSGESIVAFRPRQGTIVDLQGVEGTPKAMAVISGVDNLTMRSMPAEKSICLPQAADFSLAASRLGWPLQNTSLISLHGRALENVVRYLQPGVRILVLTWDGEAPGRLARLLVERGLGRSEIIVCEALGGDRERIRQRVAARFDLEDVAKLKWIGLEVAAAPPATIPSLAAGLEDPLFENDGQLARREVRAVTICALAPRHGELLWDVGLGSGGISIEWLLRHPSLRAIGFEADARRADHASRNAAALGAPDLRIVPGNAPQSFAGQPAPDVVFIGGGLSTPGLFDAAWSALKPGGRLVVNGASLAAEARLIDLFGRLGGEVVRIDMARAGKAGSGAALAWRPAAPIVQWRTVKPLA